MDVSLRDRLMRLGVHKGAAHLKPRAFTTAITQQPYYDAATRRPPASTALWNIEAQTIFGVAKILRTEYAVDHVHGDRPLSRGSEKPFRNVMAREALFLDTETTGLAGGAGTLAFLVGVGYFEAESTSSEGHPAQFVIDQYFLNEPADEAAMLAHLDGRVSKHAALVTFNGRAFDVPLLETRYTMQRIAPSFAEKEHLDLLMPARQVWRGTLASCSLGSIEFHLLGVHRDQQDIAGFLIPQIYREYLQAGAPRAHDDMQRVMYHNLHDILSMVTLTSRLHDAFHQPQAPEEHFAVAVQHERARNFEQAVQTYSVALHASASNPLPPGHTPPLRSRLAANLKKLDRHAEAVEHWQLLAAEDDLVALIELAKYYEWRERSIDKALKCARRAHLVAQDPITRADVMRRIERLGRKNAAPR